MRGLENLVAAIFVIAMIVSLAAAASILVSRAVYGGIHVISSRALMAMPPAMELRPLSSTCNDGFLAAELKINDNGLGRFGVVVYDLSGRVVGAYSSDNGSVYINIPCNEDVVITVNSSNGGFWIYRYELDPNMHCLSGYIVNASALLRGCKNNIGNMDTYSSMLQPLWIRGILVSNDALSLLNEYGVVPGLVINETNYVVLGRSNSYVYRFIPSRVSASTTLYDNNLTVDVSYPIYCRPGIGCLYRDNSYHTPLPENATRVAMHLEYEYASLVAERPGWLHIRDYRVVLPLHIQLYGDSAGEYSGWGWQYTWLIEANLSPPFFYARIKEVGTRLSNGHSYTICTKKSISSLYSRSIDVLLVPLLVSRDSAPITLSYGVLPVQYNVQGMLSWRFWSNLPSWTIKTYGPYRSMPQYVAIYAYLVPLPEWRLGLPVDMQIAQLTRSNQVIKAVYETTLLNLTRIATGEALGGTISIDPGKLFNKAGLLGNTAILAIELVLVGKGSNLIVDTTNNTDDMGYSHFCNTGIAFISGIDDYVHLSILPASIHAQEGSWILLLPGEGVEGYESFAYNVSELDLPSTLSSKIELHESHSTGEYLEVFSASALATKCQYCKILPVPSTSVKIINTSNIRVIGTTKASLESCVSAETIFEEVDHIGQDALIIK